MPALVSRRGEWSQASTISKHNTNPYPNEFVVLRVDPLFKTVIKSGPSGPAPAAPSAPKAKAIDTRAIWSESEIEYAKELQEDDTYDGRIKPDYDILYKQSISAEDVFMNLSMKDGSTIHCEAIVVKIILPGATINQVTLEVTPTRMLVRSNK